MTGEPIPPTEPEALEEASRAPLDGVIADLRSILTLDAGLSQILVERQYRGVASDLSATLDIDAGLQSITTPIGDVFDQDPPSVPTASIDSYGAHLLEKLSVQDRMNLYKQQILAPLRRLPGSRDDVYLLNEADPHRHYEVLEILGTTRSRIIDPKGSLLSERNPVQTMFLAYVSDKVFDLVGDIQLFLSNAKLSLGDDIDHLADGLLGRFSGLRFIEVALRTFTNADLSKLDLSVGNLDGVRWSARTRWPAGLLAEVAVMSVEVEPGIFEVQHGRRRVEV